MKIIECIKYCYEKNKAVSFYFDNGDRLQHLVGFIQKFNDSEILIAHISSHGFYDGFILKHIEDLKRIEYDGEYENKVHTLYALKNQEHLVIDTFIENEEYILDPVLEFAEKNELVISFECEDTVLSGLIDSFEENLLHLIILNDFGKKSGIAVIDLCEVSTISLDTDDEQDLLLLYKNK